MRSDTRITSRFDLPAAMPARRLAWTPLLLAVALGAIEWAALARSRAIDTLSRSRAADRLAAAFKRR